jgi:segregation and condensation protein B
MESSVSKNKVEALLFVSKEPLTPEKIAKVLDTEETIVYRWLAELEKDYIDRGITMRRIAGGFELVVSSDYYDVIEPIVQKDYQQLSRPAMESIVAIALLQPVRKSKIALYREVKNPDAGLQPLLDLHLIKETDKGFITTDAFLKYFGINDIAELNEKINSTNKVL